MNLVKMMNMMMQNNFISSSYCLLHLLTWSHLSSRVQVKVVQEKFLHQDQNVPRIRKHVTTTN